jgi:hypothetical protein
MQRRGGVDRDVGWKFQRVGGLRSEGGRFGQTAQSAKLAFGAVGGPQVVGTEAFRGEVKVIVSGMATKTEQRRRSGVRGGL